MSIPLGLSSPFIDVFADAMAAGQYVIRQESKESPYAQTTCKPAHFKTRQITEICQTCLDSLSHDTSSTSLVTRIAALKKLDTALSRLVTRIEHSIRQRWWYFLFSLFGYRAQAPKDIQQLLLSVKTKQAELIDLSTTSSSISAEQDSSEGGDEEQKVPDQERVVDREPVGEAHEGDERIPVVEMTHVGAQQLTEEGFDLDEPDLSIPENEKRYVARLQRDLDEKGCRDYLTGTLYQKYGCIPLFRQMVDQAQTDLATKLLSVLSNQQLLLLEQAYRSRRRDVPPAVLEGVVARFGHFTARDYLSFSDVCAPLSLEDATLLKNVIYNKWVECLRNQSVRKFVDSLRAREIAFLLDIMPKHAAFDIPLNIWSACADAPTSSPEKEQGLRTFLQGASRQTMEQIHDHFLRDAPRFYADLYRLFNSEQRAFAVHHWLNKNVEDAVSAMDAICRHFPDDMEMWKGMFASMVQWRPLREQAAQRIRLYRAVGVTIFPYFIDACRASSQSMEAQNGRAFLQEVFRYLEDVDSDSLRKLGTFPDEEVKKWLDACQENPKLFFKILFVANWQTVEYWNIHLRRGLERVAATRERTEIGKWASDGLKARETKPDAQLLSPVLGDISVDVNNQEALSHLYQAICRLYEARQLGIDFSYFDSVNLSLFVHPSRLWNPEMLRQLDASRLPQLLAHLPVSELQNLATAMRSWSPQQIARLFSHLTPRLQGTLVFLMVALTKGNHGFLGTIPPLYDKEQSPLLKIFIDRSLSQLDLNDAQLMPILYFADFLQYRLLKDYAARVIKAISDSKPKNQWRRAIAEEMQGSMATFLRHHPDFTASCQQFSSDRLYFARLEPSDYPSFNHELSPEERRRLFGVHNLNVQSIGLHLSRITPEGVCMSYGLSSATEKEYWKRLYPRLNTPQLLALYEFIDPLDKVAMIPDLGVEPLLGLMHLLSVKSDSLEPEKSLCIQTLVQRLFADERTLPEFLPKNSLWSTRKKDLLWSTEKEVLGQVLRLTHHLDGFYEPIKNTDREQLKARIADLKSTKRLTRVPHSAAFLDSLLTQPAGQWGWQGVLVAKLVEECLQFTEQDSEWETLDLIRYAHVAQIHRLQNALSNLKETFAPFAGSLQELVGMVAQKFEEDHVIERLREDVNARAIFNREIGLYYLNSVA